MNLTKKNIQKKCVPVVGFIYRFVFLFYFFKNFFATTVKTARVLCFYTNWETACYLKKVLHFIQAQFCGPAVQGPQG